MNIAALKTELDAGHPGTGAYDDDDATALAQLHVSNRTTNKTSMSGDEVFAATDATEFTALTAGEKSLWMAFCGRASIDPFGSANVALVSSIFTGGDTLVALQAARTNSINRLTELGFGKIVLTDVTKARAM